LGAGSVYADDLIRLGGTATSGNAEVRTLGYDGDATTEFTAYRGGGFHGGGSFHGGYHGGYRGYAGHYHGGYYGRSYVGHYHGGYYRPYHHYGYYRPFIGIGLGFGYGRGYYGGGYYGGGYNTGYASPVYYSSPAYYGAPASYANPCTCYDGYGYGSSMPYAAPVSPSYSAPSQTLPPPQSEALPVNPRPAVPPGSVTYPYNGDPASLVPLPPTGPNPTVAPKAPATVPPQGRLVSLPEQPAPAAQGQTRFAYPAYGESGTTRTSTFAADRVAPPVQTAQKSR